MFITYLTLDLFCFSRGGVANLGVSLDGVFAYGWVRDLSGLWLFAYRIGSGT